MNTILLTGCTTVPMTGYLKSIGILRLLNEQRDRDACGWWEGEQFALRTILTSEEIEHFFCDDYEPTPLVAPWNGGSGFYEGDPVEALESIIGSGHKRFAPYRDLISTVRSWSELPTFTTIGDILSTLHEKISSMKSGKKRETLEKLLNDVVHLVPEELNDDDIKLDSIVMKQIEIQKNHVTIERKIYWTTWWNSVKKARTEANKFIRERFKKDLFPICRSRLSDSIVRWLDALAAIPPGGDPVYNPLLGTGGNDGRFELSNNYMQVIVRLFLESNPEATLDMLRASLFGDSVQNLPKFSIGQYDPGNAGGYNQGMEIETKNIPNNPWDFLLSLEGSLLFAGGIARRSPTAERARYTSPFTVSFSPVGFTSSSQTETKGVEKEIWLPIWSNPAKSDELAYFFSEGRSVVGRRIARNGIDFSRAAGTLGVDRGIRSFERYAYLRRRGDSSVALPAGRIPVRYQPNLELLSETDGIVSSLSMFMRGFKNVPANFDQAQRSIDEAIFACSRTPGPTQFASLVRAFGRIEQLLAFRDRSKKPIMNHPLSGLSPTWISIVDDGGIECRIAAALSSIFTTGNVGPIRSTIGGVDKNRPWQWAKKANAVTWHGSSLSERLGNALIRRLLDQNSSGNSRPPVSGLITLEPDDVMHFLIGKCDDKLIEELLWGFMLIDWRKGSKKKTPLSWKKPVQCIPLDRAWCLLKLLFLPGQIRGIDMKREPRIATLLAAGRTNDACSVAFHRLRVTDLKPFPVEYESSLDPQRILASMLIPVRAWHRLTQLVLEKQNDISLRK